MMIEWWRVDEVWLWFKNNIIFAMVFFLALGVALAVTTGSQQTYSSTDPTLQQMKQQIQCMKSNQRHILLYYQCVQAKKPNCTLPLFKDCQPVPFASPTPPAPLPEGGGGL